MVLPSGHMATGGSDDVAPVCPYINAHTRSRLIPKAGMMLEEDVAPASSSEAFYGIRNSPIRTFEVSKTLVPVTPCIYVNYVKTRIEPVGIPMLAVG